MNKKLKLIKQRFNYDCGQCCLMMLGYDGYKLFPNKEITTKDLLSIPELKEVTVPVGQEETLNYNVPHIWCFLPKSDFQSGNSCHFVIRYNEIILCPRVGIMNFKEYKSRFIQFVLQEFFLPVKN